MSTKLILIRHGQTDFNYRRQYSSFSNIGLNEKGKKQAAQLRKGLSKEKIQKVYSSDMKRTVQFAKIVFEGMFLEELPELREINFGVFEGLTYKEIMNKYSEIYRKWLDNPLSIIIPGGESLNRFAGRVRKALADVLSRNKNSTAAIVTHAGPIRIILCDVLKLDLKEISKIQPNSASISIIEFVKGKSKIHLLNDTSYSNG